MRKGEQTRLTRRQKLIAQLCVEHPDWTGAAILRAAGLAESTAMTQAKRELGRPGTVAEINRLLAKGGISDELFAKRLKEALDYEETKFWEGRAVADVVDNAGRLRALEFVAKLKGWLRDPGEVEKVTTIVQVLVPVVCKYVSAADLPRMKAEMLSIAGEKVVTP